MQSRRSIEKVNAVSSEWVSVDDKPAKCCTMLEKDERCFVQRTDSGLLEPRGGFREEDVGLLSDIVKPLWNEV